MNDLKAQLEQMMKMGGMKGMMGMMPGMAKMQKQLDDAGFDDAVIKRQIALINSMTKKERANPDLMQASRKKRVAAGAGQDVSDLNKLLKMHRQMADAMKKLGKMGKTGLSRGGLGALMGKGAPAALKDMDPSKMDPKAMEEAARRMGMGGLPGLGGGTLPPGLSGFGKKK
jgi:signal recognition particle subunit SRP54